MTLVPATSIYIDESNSTGENLLDTQQPIFSLSAVHLDAQKAQELLDDVMRRLPHGHGEPKYTKLSKTGAGRGILLDTLGELSPNDTRAYIIHKRFMVVTKIIDTLAVEVAADLGYDMYADDSARVMAHFYYFIGPVLGGAKQFDAVLKSFVDMMRLREAALIDEFFSSLEQYASTLNGEDFPGLPFLQGSRYHAEDVVSGLRSGRYRDMLDPAIPCLVELAKAAGERFGIVQIIHDHSEVIKRNRDLLLNLNQLPDLWRPGHNLELLPVSVIDFSDSRQRPPLQVADWVAGAARQWANSFYSDSRDPFAERLESIVQPWIVGTIWPDKDVLPQADNT